jgi:7-carboxy-7-deazaguanine synthase
MQERFIETKPHTLIVNEIFHSIQGESSHMGRPCVFVRLTYCNIRCSYCDTEYAFYEGKEMTIDEILECVRAYRCKLVEVTGGEPLFQANTPELLSRLCDEHYEVLLETGGSLDIGTVDSRVKRIVDFKCPSSKMVKKNLWKNVEYLTQSDEVKFVIGNREDYEWAKEKIREFELDKRCPILMSVVFGELEPIELAEWILEEKLNVRFQLQMHKYIWNPQTRGV